MTNIQFELFRMLNKIFQSRYHLKYYYSVCYLFLVNLNEPMLSYIFFGVARSSFRILTVGGRTSNGPLLQINQRREHKTPVGTLENTTNIIEVTLGKTETPTVNSSCLILNVFCVVCLFFRNIAFSSISFTTFCIVLRSRYDACRAGRSDTSNFK